MRSSSIMETDKKGRVADELPSDGEKWVYDSSVDHKGRVPLRSSTGVWKAALFIIAIEFGERLSYFGLAMNLIIYLTHVVHEEVKTAAKNVNYWTGVTTMTPLIGGFIADAYLGRFSTVLVSSSIYLVGLILLTMSQLVPGLKPCQTDTCHGSLRLHEVVFFVAMYLISVGTGGHKASLESFGADQFDDGHPEERKKKMSYFNWWNFGLCSGLVTGVTAIVYIQDSISWWLADIVLTAVMGLGIVIFVMGRPVYRYRVPTCSPLTPLLQVCVAAVAKRHLSLPSDAKDLYEVSSSLKGNRLLRHTNKYSFLDKAAVIEHNNDETAPATAREKVNPWRLATVTQVEETKLVLATVPIWLVSLPFGLCMAQTATFFIKQASIMDRKIAGSFEIPPATVYSLTAIGMIISVCLYDRVLVPFLRRARGNERGISILQRIGIGMAFPVAAMATAAGVERKRLTVANAGGSMSVLWLIPQFMILGFGDGFTVVGLQEYFYDQVPDSMRSLGIAFYLSVIGVANFLSSLLITVLDHLTERGGRASWFAKDLNSSRLDYFYWLLAVVNAVNLFPFVFLARRHAYKSTVQQAKAAIANSPGGDEDGEILVV